MKDPRTNTVRLGVIGAGEISRITLPMILDSALRPVALADVNRSAAEALASELGDLEVYDSLQALLAADIDAVYIATPPFLHRTMVEQVIAAGKHVICEKPWMLDSSEAVAVEQLAAAHPELTVAACASRFTFAPAFDKATEILASGELGRLREVRMQARIAPPQSIEKLPKWKRDATQSGGGLMVDWGVYEIEWLLQTLGESWQPTRVFASFDNWKREDTDLESSYHIIIEAVNGPTVTVSRTAEIGPQGQGIQLRGEQGGVDLPFTPGDNDYQRHSLDSEGQLITDAPVETLEMNWGTILTGPFIDFAEAILSERPARSTAAHQTRLQRLMDAICQSGRTHQLVSLNQPN